MKFAILFLLAVTAFVALIRWPDKTGIEIALPLLLLGLLVRIGWR